MEKKLDIKEVVALLWSKKKLFIRGAIIAFILSCVWILPKPRYYISTVSLAPETESGGDVGGSLSSLASSFGFNMGGSATGDAIYPMLYPDIMSSSDFLVSLFDVRVKDSKGEVDTDYYTYLTEHQEEFIWAIPMNRFKRWMRSLMPKTESFKLDDGKGGEQKVNPFCLSEKQDMVVNALRQNIVGIFDLKTEVITISVTDQDKLVCATMADSVRTRLQKYITDYRTSKARIDAEYYKKLSSEAKESYEAAAKAYSDYCDAHQNVLLQAFISERDMLENDMQAKLSTYTALDAQYQAALAKIQQRTPAFTIIQGATVPIKPAGPKRMIFVAAMMFLTCFCISVYVLRKYLF